MSAAAVPQTTEYHKDPENTLGAYGGNNNMSPVNNEYNGVHHDIEAAAAGDFAPGGAGVQAPINPSTRYAGMADAPRNHMVAVVAEFVGTFMFLLFAELIANNANLDPSVKSLSGPSASQTLMISFGFGFSVMACVFVFYRISGGQLNPFVTLTLLWCRILDPIRALVIIIAQLVAGICAAAVADALTPGEVLFANGLGEGVSRSRGVFIECFGTAMLLITVLFMAVEKHRATHMAPLAIGVALFVGHLFAVPNTGAGLNFARSLGPAIVKRSFPDYFWIYLIGGLLATFLAAGLHYLLKFLHYETANPGQDSDY